MVILGKGKPTKVIPAVIPATLKVTTLKAIKHLRFISDCGMSMAREQVY